MRKYICSEAHRCDRHFTQCIAKEVFDEDKCKFSSRYHDGYKGEGTHATPCEENKVYFIPYFEFLIRKTLKGNK